ncbi:MAG: hypothetical protein RL268_1579 [Pseudomonadota bacterium]|jgi:hypothetical protein
MFNRIRTASTLDKAIALSLAAMLSFNVLVLAQQVDRSASFAQIQGEAAQQA